MKTKRANAGQLNEGERGTLFATELLNWNRQSNKRQMPWKGEKDPYKIWLSEIILQQTRVEQGLKYYEAFIKAFPAIQDLAAADEAKVFKLWEGLGYYSRCRNLIATAKYISENLNGKFPDQFDNILALKGVGQYTASAIASFAFGLPHAVVDGNVFRVLSRVFDEEVPIDSNQGKKRFSELANSILPQSTPGEYNQAIMDFGATVCKPVPACDTCFFTQNCLAYAAGKQQVLPVKEKKIQVRPRWFNYLIVRYANEVLVQQRSEKDIWQGLYQFLLVETGKGLAAQHLLPLFETEFGLNEIVATAEWTDKQLLSHQIIHFHFLATRLKKKRQVKGYQWMDVSAANELAFPKTLQAVIQRRLIINS